MRIQAEMGIVCLDLFAICPRFRGNLGYKKKQRVGFAARQALAPETRRTI
jgi:hypothetical protein